MEGGSVLAEVVLLSTSFFPCLSASCFCRVRSTWQQQQQQQGQPMSSRHSPSG